MEKEEKINVLREAIEAGEQSGYVANFDCEKFLEKMRLKYTM